MNVKQVIEKTLRSLAYRKKHIPGQERRYTSFVRGKTIILINYTCRSESTGTGHAFLSVYPDKETLDLVGIPGTIQVSEMWGIMFGSNQPEYFYWGKKGETELELVNALYSVLNSLKATEKK